MARQPSAFYQGRKSCWHICKGYPANTHRWNWELHRAWNLCETVWEEKCTWFFSLYSCVDVMSRTERRRQALEHGRHPHSPVSPGQLQRPQSWAFGAPEDQQTLVSELPTPRTPPQTLRRSGLQRGKRSMTLFCCGRKPSSRLIILVRSCMSTSSASPYILSLI